MSEYAGGVENNTEGEEAEEVAWAAEQRVVECLVALNERYGE